MRQGTGGEGGGVAARNRNQFKEGSVVQRGKETNWAGVGGWGGEKRIEVGWAMIEAEGSTALLLLPPRTQHAEMPPPPQQTAAAGLRGRPADVLHCSCSRSSPDAPVHPGLHVGRGQITLITAALPGWAGGSVFAHLNYLAEVYWSVVQPYASRLIHSVSD